MTIKLILEPTVELVNRPNVDREAIARWLKATAGTEWTAGGTGTDAEHLCEGAGRGCYWSYAKGRPTGEWFAHVLESEHYSVLEHASFTFAIAGVSRSLTHELVRHRHLSPSQLSQRYCDQADPEIGLGLVVPVAMIPVMKEWDDYNTSVAGGPLPWAHFHFDNWYRSNEQAVLSYQRIAQYLLANGRDRKTAHDAARSLLPEACETRLWLSGNARAWLEALGKRRSGAAALEIDRLARVIHAKLAAEMPLVFGEKP